MTPERSEPRNQASGTLRSLVGPVKCTLSPAGPELGQVVCPTGSWGASAAGAQEEVGAHKGTPVIGKK